MMKKKNMIRTMLTDPRQFAHVLKMHEACSQRAGGNFTDEEKREFNAFAQKVYEKIMQ